MNNPLLKQDLYRDAIAAAARRRRKIRLTRRVGTAAVVCLAALFLALPRKQEINPPVVAKAPPPVKKDYEIIRSDEGLLSWVADQGHSSRHPPRWAARADSNRSEPVDSSRKRGTRAKPQWREGRGGLWRWS